MFTENAYCFEISRRLLAPVAFVLVTKRVNIFTLNKTLNARQLTLLNVLNELRRLIIQSRNSIGYIMDLYMKRQWFFLRRIAKPRGMDSIPLLRAKKKKKLALVCC